MNEAVVIATVAGKPLTDVPHDLFIPPDALEILLDSFTGPLDVLLYLIRRQNIDIMDIPILRITKQYMQYIELMEQRRMALAADYLVMAAMLAEIKSRMLLPREPAVASHVEEDPRTNLVRRLQVYEQYKKMSFLIDALNRVDRDVFPVRLRVDPLLITKQMPAVDASSLSKAMASLQIAQARIVSHSVQREWLSVRARMTDILARIQTGEYIELSTFYSFEEGRMGLVVSLLAILELAKQSLLSIMQTTVYAPIYIQNIAIKTLNHG